jgi:hypothetical protein
MCMYVCMYVCVCMCVCMYVCMLYVCRCVYVCITIIDTIILNIHTKNAYIYDTHTTQVKAQLYKLASIGLCANTVGQVCVCVCMCVCVCVCVSSLHRIVRQHCRAGGYWSDVYKPIPSMPYAVYDIRNTPIKPTSSILHTYRTGGLRPDGAAPRHRCRVLSHYTNILIYSYIHILIYSYIHTLIYPYTHIHINIYTYIHQETSPTPPTRQRRMGSWRPCTGELTCSARHSTAWRYVTMYRRS